MGPEKHEKVLEKLATSDKATIVIGRQTDGKMRVTSGSWDGEKVIALALFFAGAFGWFFVH
jgi:hypothetical protein